MSVLIEDSAVAARPEPQPAREQRRVRPGNLMLHFVFRGLLPDVGGRVRLERHRSRSRRTRSSSRRCPWALPANPQFGNYVDAWTTAKIGQYFANSST